MSYYFAELQDNQFVKCYFNFIELILFCDYRRQKIAPGTLMKAVVRPGGGDATPSDNYQVELTLPIHFIIYYCN